MTRMFGMLLGLALLCAGAMAAQSAVTPSAPATAAPAADQGEDKDVYYAPAEADSDAEALSPTAGGVSATAAIRGSYTSRARISAFAWGSPQKELKGADIFLNGAFLGRSPVQLNGVLIDKAESELTARMDGCFEAVRAKLLVPAEGEVKVALLTEDAASWYTTPSWLVGLGLVAASAAIYNSKSPDAGLALTGGGVGLISLSQISARLVHIPALKRQVEAYNDRPEPVPDLPR